MNKTLHFPFSLCSLKYYNFFLIRFQCERVGWLEKCRLLLRSATELYPDYVRLVQVRADLEQELLSELSVGRFQVVLRHS